MLPEFVSKNLEFDENNPSEQTTDCVTHQYTCSSFSSMQCVQRSEPGQQNILVFDHLKLGKTSTFTVFECCLN